MIYITGDTHANSNVSRFLKAKELKDIKYLIVTGDFGYVYFNRRSENQMLDFLNDLGYVILFVDGNHEGFKTLYSYPEEEWNGGKVHKIRKNILHLKRGEIFNIENKKFFTFGGANSIDKAYQISLGQWFEEEMPNNDEMDYGIRNLEKNDYKVDYIITHDCDSDSLLEIIPYTEVNSLNRFFRFIKNVSEYKSWYFGHHHINYNLDNKHKCIYDNIVKVE